MADPTSRLSSLLNSPVSLVAVRQDAWYELSSILSSLTGSIVMVIDPRLSSVLRLIVPDGNLGALKELGVDELQRLDWLHVDAKRYEHVVYLVRPGFTVMKQVARQIHHASRVNPSLAFHLRFVPRRSFISEKVLEEEGVFGTLDIGVFSVDLVPIDDDVLSLELPDAFRECYIEEDHSSLNAIARSVMKLQRLYGVIPRVHAKGHLSKRVVDILGRLRREEGDGLSYSKPEIDQIILLDRNVDYITPMVTPLTYEGLLDEVFGIETAAMDIEKRCLGSDAADPTDSDDEATLVSFPLTSNDKLYAEIRDLNIASVKPLLQSKARDIQAIADTRHELRQSKISDIKKFVKRISGLTAEKRSLYQYINITEQVQKTTNSETFFEQWQIERAILVEERTAEVFERIDTAIGKRESISLVLQLLCLQCQAEDGFKQKTFDHYRREIVQTYGFEHLFTLYNLERLGLLKQRQGTSWRSGTWSSVRDALKLIVDDPRLDDPDDMAYVTSGYAPMTVRLIERAITRGWDSLESTLGLLPGPTVLTAQTPLAPEVGSGAGSGAGAGAGAGAGSGAGGGDGEGDGAGAKGGAGGGGGGGGAGDGLAGLGVADVTDRRRQVVLVFFIGGVTYLEIASLRYLSDKLPYDFMVATTSIINGKKLINSMTDDLQAEVEEGGPDLSDSDEEEHKS